MKTVYPPQTKFAGGIINVLLVWFPAGQGLKKVDFSTFFKVR